MPNLEAPRLAHEAETAPHSANADAIAKSLALRTATGTLKAAKATKNDELVNLELLQEIEQKANDKLKEAFKKVDDELADIIRAGTPAISSDNFELQEETKRIEMLNARVIETKPYHNALRNERGSLTVPEAEADAEAVNKKQLETHVSGKIAELVGGAPGTLDTLKEIADALKDDAGIVNTLTQKITTAKEEAVQTAEEDATKKANAAQAEAVKTGTEYTDSKPVDYYTKADVDKSQQKQDERIKKLEAARPTSGAGALYDFSKAEAVKTAKEAAEKYTNDTITTKLENYYTKTDVDESQQKQDEKIAALEAACLTSGAGALYDFSKAEAVKTGETIKLADGTVKDIYRLCVERENVQDFFNIQIAGHGDITKIIKIAGTATRDNGATEDTSHLIQTLINNANKTIDINIIEKNTIFNFLISVYFIV